MKSPDRIDGAINGNRRGLVNRLLTSVRRDEDWKGDGEEEGLIIGARTGEYHLQS
jgi:hypothetical protein